MSAKLREERAQQYWVLSRQWRGDSSLGAITVGDLLSRLADLAGSLNSLGWQRAENHTAALLSQVINNKRSRKRKPTNNIVNLNEIRPIRAQALLQEMRRLQDPRDLVGMRITMTIKQVG